MVLNSVRYSQQNNGQVLYIFGIEINVGKWERININTIYRGDMCKSWCGLLH